MSAYLPLVQLAVSLANEGMKAYNEAKARKYIDRINGIMHDLHDEMSRGQDADDAKIQHLKGELKIEIESARMDVFNKPIK